MYVTAFPPQQVLEKLLVKFQEEKSKVIIFSISVKVYTGIQRTLTANDQVLTSWYSPLKSQCSICLVAILTLY